MNNLVNFEAHLNNKCENAIILEMRWGVQSARQIRPDGAGKKIPATEHRRPNYNHDSIKKCREIFLADFNNLLEVCDISGEFSYLSQCLVGRLKKKYLDQMATHGNCQCAILTNLLGGTMAKLTGGRRNDSWRRQKVEARRCWLRKIRLRNF